MHRLQFLRSLPLIQSHKQYARGSLMFVGQRTWAIDAENGRLHGYNVAHNTPSAPVNVQLPIRHWSPETGGRAVVLGSSANNSNITIAVMDCDVVIMTVLQKQELVQRQHTLLSPATSKPFKDMVVHADALWMCTSQDVFTWNGHDHSQPLPRFSVQFCIRHIQKGSQTNTITLLTECNRILECDLTGNILTNTFGGGLTHVAFEGDHSVVQNAYSTAFQNECVSIMKTDDRISIARFL